MIDGGMRRSALWAISLIAILHGAFYVVYLRPEWGTAWGDREGYVRLGAALAESGRFTRYPDSPVFVPEVLRTPGYPAFIAVFYRLFGIGNDVAVAIAQVLILPLLCLLVYALTRRLASERTAIAAAAMTALFSPIPHFAGLILTEFWTTVVLTAAMVVCVRAVQEQRLAGFALAGVLFSATTLVRPAFVLLPFFLAIGMPLFVRSQRTRAALGRWLVLATLSGLTLVPWFTYNYVYLGTFTLSPAGGIGRGLWEGAWQGRWPGGVQAQLTQAAAEPIDSAALDARVQGVAAKSGLPEGPMREYVHEWRDIRAVWDTPKDPTERANARVVADQRYLDAAVRHMREDPIGHARRRITRGLFQLWAADVPIRYSQINQVPTLVIRAIWLVQVLALVAAAAGLVVLVRRGRWADAVLLALPLIYVTGVHLPLLCEARQSLPVKPLVLALAAIGFAGRSEREHDRRSQLSALGASGRKR
jgi:4-amino-4-deoxy-L-arabinose transferase-like glycosyltransferase